MHHWRLPGSCDNASLTSIATVQLISLRQHSTLVYLACKFTGKERDTESGNDYFEARYYSSAMGRFMSPDWSAKVEPVPYSKLDNPQSLNLYSYTLNNPLSNADTDGHACSGVLGNTGSGFCTRAREYGK